MNGKIQRKKPVASISLDMDNLWCYQRSFGIVEWKNYDSFFSLVVPKILDFLQQHQLRITFFVIGKDADQPENKALLTSIAQQDHEIANHSYHHQVDLHQLSKEQILTELKNAHQAIHKACGKNPTGFRGPAFGVSPAMIEALSALNYRYDASTLPSSLGALARQYHQKRAYEDSKKEVEDNALYGKLGGAWQPLTPYYWQCSDQKMLEIPVTTMPIFRFPFHGTYLNYIADYSETIALSYFRVTLKLCKFFKIKPSFLLHCTDFLGADDNIPLSYLPGMKRSTSKKMAFMHKVINIYKKEFQPETMANFVEQLDTINTLKKMY